MNVAFEKVKMLVGMEVDEESAAVRNEDSSSSFAFMDDFNRNCTLSTKQVPLLFFSVSFSNSRFTDFLANSGFLVF